MTEYSLRSYTAYNYPLSAIMRTYITYIILGTIGFTIFKLTNVELNIVTTFVGILSIPVVEYLINIKHHRQNALYEKMKTMSAKELDILTGSKPPKKIEEYSSTIRTKPQPFGYKANWIALNSNQIEKILESLEYDKSVKTNWEIGVNATFQNRNLRFICPTIDNWTLILGDSIDYVSSNEVKSKLSELSKLFGEAYYFGSFRGTGYASWAKYINGKEIRAFLIDDADVFYSVGKLEEEETILVAKRKSELNMEDKEDIEYHQKFDFLNLLGTEDDVLLMAEKWTINPMELNKYNNRELGFLIE